jgi:hypothetical protein
LLLPIQVFTYLLEFFTPTILNKKLEIKLMKKTTLGAAVTLIFSAVIATPASAITINGDQVTLDSNDIDSMFDVTYTCPAGDPDNVCNGDSDPEQAVTGATWWKLTSLTGTAAVFDIEVANTTATTFDSRLTAFGVKIIDPDATGATVTSNDNTNTTDWAAATNTTFPGFQQVDLCVFGGQNCAGGSSDGLESGEQDSLTLSIAGDYSNGILLELFPVKYQSVGPGGLSIEFAGTPTLTGGGDEPPSNIPEPSILGLFGISMFGLGLLRRRQKNG